MFGYVRPFKGEMLVKAYDAYKGVYCQLCRALGRYYGPLMRMTLSYDCTFYALLALNQREARTASPHCAIIIARAVSASSAVNGGGRTTSAPPQCNSTLSKSCGRCCRPKRRTGRG